MMSFTYKSRTRQRHTRLPLCAPHTRLPQLAGAAHAMASCVFTKKVVKKSFQFFSYVMATLVFISSSSLIGLQLKAVT